MNEIITPPVLPGTEANVPASGNNGAVSNTDEVVTVKDLMEQVTGKQFPDDETALKSLKDTYAWGAQNAQKVTTLEQQLNQITQSPDLQKQVTELAGIVKQQNFYNANPQYNKPEIKALISDMGSNPEEVVQKESFKTAVSAITKQSEMDQSKSILHSNPRLGVMQDTMKKAQELSAAGNTVQAATDATMAVLEAYPGSN